MLRKHKRITKLVLAAVAGFMAFSFVAPALAQQGLVLACFRNKTIRVPSYLFPTYQAQGATPGPCGSS